MASERAPWRAVAAALGIPHLNTGSYYRVVTLTCLVAGSDPGDAAGILAALNGRSIDFGAAGEVLLDGVDVTDRLRAPDVTAAVSEVSAHPDVRAALVEVQRAWVIAHSGNAVVEGRDIGTVVFPEAPVKIFLTADVAVRARRRVRTPRPAESISTNSQSRSPDATTSTRREQSHLCAPLMMR